MFEDSIFPQGVYLGEELVKSNAFLGEAQKEESKCEDEFEGGEIAVAQTIIVCDEVSVISVWPKRGSNLQAIYLVVIRHQYIFIP